MNLGDVERQLRAGPPEEDLYRVRGLVLDDDTATPAERLVAGRRTSRVASQGLRLVGIGVVGAVMVVGAFIAGRLTAPVVVGPAAAAPSAVRVQPAFVSDALRQAFYGGVSRDRQWLVCSTAPSLTCADAEAFRTVDPLGSAEWPSLRPVTVASGDVIVGAQLDPVLPVWAYVSPADNPAAAGPQLVPVIVHPGDTFLDLGTLAPGRYAVSVLTDPTSQMMSGQIAIGVVVR